MEAEGLAEVPCAVICGQLRDAHDGVLWHKPAGDIRSAFWHDTGRAAWHRRVAPEGLFDAGEHCVESGFWLNGASFRENRWKASAATYYKEDFGLKRNLSHPLT